MNALINTQSATDIVIHINEELDIYDRAKLSSEVQEIDGVVSASLKEKCPHLMIVGYTLTRQKQLLSYLVSEIRT